MNYQKHYDKLIKRAQHRNFVGYTEKHHIIPRCLGGSNDKSNLVALTPEEHYVAHQLLVKIYNDPKLVYAAHKMCQGRNNKLYGWLRRKHAEIVSAHMQLQGNSHTGLFWVTNGKQNKKVRNSIPNGWWRGRTEVPNLTKDIGVCVSCKTLKEDIFWWNKYKESKLTVSEFVVKVYPYNRAAFYKLKKRLAC